MTIWDLARSLLIVLSVFCQTVPAFPQRMDSVTSTFGHDTEGWNVAGLATTPVWTNGAIEAQGKTRDSLWYWKAPSKFLGDMSFANGGFLLLDLQRDSMNAVLEDQNVFIILRSSDTELRFYCKPEFAKWTRCIIPLTPYAQWLNFNEYRYVTGKEFADVLADLKSFLICGGNSRARLDNVVLKKNRTQKRIKIFAHDTPRRSSPLFRGKKDPDLFINAYSNGVWREVIPYVVGSFDSLITLPLNYDIFLSKVDGQAYSASPAFDDFLFTEVSFPEGAWRSITGELLIDKVFHRQTPTQQLNIFSSPSHDPWPLSNRWQGKTARVSIKAMDYDFEGPYNIRDDVYLNVMSRASFSKITLNEPKPAIYNLNGEWVLVRPNNEPDNGASFHIAQFESNILLADAMNSERLPKLMYSGYVKNDSLLLTAKPDNPSEGADEIKLAGKYKVDAAGKEKIDFVQARSAGERRFSVVRKIKSEIHGVLVVASSQGDESLLKTIMSDKPLYPEFCPRGASNLTESKLLLVYGKNLPTHISNTALNKLGDENIEYYSANAWLKDFLEDCHKIEDSTQCKERLNEMAFEMIDDKIDDEQFASELLKSEWIFVLAELPFYVKPGTKSFELNGQQVDWDLPAGIARAAIRFIRTKPSGEIESVNELVPNDFFRVEVDAPVELGETELTFADSKGIFKWNMNAISIVKQQGARDKYWSPLLVLRPEGTTITSELKYHLTNEVFFEGIADANDTLVVSLKEALLVNHGIPVIAKAPIQSVDSTETLWLKTLRRAAKANKMSVADNLLRDTANYIVKVFENIDVTDYLKSLVEDTPGWKMTIWARVWPSGRAQPERICPVTLGDHAAMLLLRERFVRTLRSYYKTLELHRDNADFIDGFWREMKKKSTPDGRFPFSEIEVAESIHLRSLMRWVLATTPDGFSHSKEFLRWRHDAMQNGFQAVLKKLKYSLDFANNIKDNDIDGLLRLTGAGFEPIEQSLIPEILKKQAGPNPDDFTWVPDVVARFYVKNVCYVATLLKDNETVAKLDTDVLLCAASLFCFPLRAISYGGELAAAIFGVTTAAAEFARDMKNLMEEDAEIDFSDGARLVLGDGRYNEALLNSTPAWARLLVFLGPLGGLGDMGDIVKIMNKTSLDDAYRNAGRIFRNFEGQEAIAESYKNLSVKDKNRFLTLLGEAEALKRTNPEMLSKTQRNLIASAEQFHAMIETEARAKKIAELVQDSPADLKAELKELQNEVPIIRDPVQDKTVKIVPVYDESGKFVRSVRLHVGQQAGAREIAEHLDAIKRVMEYQKLSGKAGDLLSNMRAWARRVFKGEPEVGTLAWEAMLEVEKLSGIIDSKLKRLELKKLSPDEIATFSRDLRDLSEQLGRHQRNFELFKNNPVVGQGFIAAEKRGKATGFYEGNVEEASNYVEFRLMALEQLSTAGGAIGKKEEVMTDLIQVWLGNVGMKSHKMQMRSGQGIDLMVENFRKKIKVSELKQQDEFRGEWEKVNLKKDLSANDIPDLDPQLSTNIVQQSWTFILDRAIRTYRLAGDDIELANRSRRVVEELANGKLERSIVVMDRAGKVFELSSEAKILEIMSKLGGKAETSLNTLRPYAHRWLISNDLNTLKTQVSQIGGLSSSNKSAILADINSIQNLLKNQTPYHKLLVKSLWSNIEKSVSASLGEWIVKTSPFVREYCSS